MAERKRPLLLGIGWGEGTAIGIAAIVGGFLWYQSRPKPTKPWNAAAIVCNEPPSFDSTSDHKQMEFTYPIENHTNRDYQIESDSELQLMAKNADGTLLPPLPSDMRRWQLPIFIPANQKALVTFSLTLSGIPEQKPSETDAQYHERLRAYCEEHIGGVANFVIFDRGNRYQINLQRWRAEPPKKSP
jgi:hypothetical protein